MSSARLPLSVIVVSYETRELTLACLRSLYAETPELDFELLVVDNASTDGSAQAIAAQFPEARLMALESNIGFGAANNLAAQEAQGRRILLLNPDTEIRDRAVERLVAFADEHPQARLFGGRTVFPDGSLNRGSCWGAPTLWSTFCLAAGWANRFQNCAWLHPEGLGAWQRDSVREVAIVSGCFLLIDTELWHALGGFHPAFFMYGEDADLCLRARDLGARALICPEAEIMHLGGASERVRADKMVRLFTAKAQMFRMHWGRVRGRIGVALLDLWALWRVVALKLARRRAALAQWRDVLARRGEWHRAFAEAPLLNPRR